jgi:hypothetical protein
MVEAVDDDFIFVDNDDAMSVSSSRSSLFLVDDPSNDALMLHGETTPQKNSLVLNAPPEEEAAMPEEALQNPCTDANAFDASGQDAPQPEALPQEQPKFVCSSCSLDVGLQSDIIWEGYMGANKAAYLFSKVLNMEPAAEPRKQQLSTGHFLLQDVRCKSCSATFGWSYLKAWNQDQKYKEGTTIVERSLLQLVGDSPSESATTAVQCR